METHPITTNDVNIQWTIQRTGGAFEDSLENSIYYHANLIYDGWYSTPTLIKSVKWVLFNANNEGAWTGVTYFKFINL